MERPAFGFGLRAVPVSCAAEPIRPEAIDQPGHAHFGDGLDDA